MAYQKGNPDRYIRGVWFCHACDEKVTEAVVVFDDEGWPFHRECVEEWVGAWDGFDVEELTEVRGCLDGRLSVLNAGTQYKKKMSRR